VALSAELLVVRAQIVACQSRPNPELGIDWWDVRDGCPYHGFTAAACACGYNGDNDYWTYDEGEQADRDFGRYALDADHFDRIADRERVKVKEDRWG
jgi:hypothetical protein